MRIRSVRELGAVLRARRRELELTQSDVAGAAGVTRQWLAELEKGKTTAQIGRCLGVIDALDLDITLEPRQRSVDAEHLDRRLDLLLDDLRADG